MKTLASTSFRFGVSPQHFSAILIIVVLTITYWGITNNGFHLDDKRNILNNPAVQLDEFSFEKLIDAAKSGSSLQRPVAYLTFAVDWLRGAGHPAQFLQTNLIIHILNALLVSALLIMILRFFFNVDAFPATLAGFMASLFWALHPIQVQSVTYIVQRMTLLAATFILVGLVAYLIARRTSRPGWYWVLGISAVLGALSKQIAWLLPVYLILMELSILGQQPFWRSWGGRTLFLIPAILVAYIAFDLAVGGFLWSLVAGGYEYTDFTLYERLLTQPRVVLFHLYQVIWPHVAQFSIEHDFTVSTGLTQPSTTWLSLIALAIWLTIGLLALATERFRKPAFFLIWPLAALSMESSFAPLEMIFEHRMYVPMIGVAGLFALGVVRILQVENTTTRTVLLCVPVVILGYLASVTSDYLPLWRDERTLYGHAVNSAPGSARAWELYGNGLERAKEDRDAITAYTRSLQLDGENWRVLTDRGALLLRAGEVDQAEKDLDQAIAINPYVAAPFANRAVVYFRRGELSKALSDLDTAIEIRPYFVQALYNRALLKLQLREYAGARQDIDRAFYYAPSNPAVIQLRSEIYGGTMP